MGEIADDVIRQGEDDYWDLSDEDRQDADERWGSYMANQRRLRRERAAENRGPSRRLPSPNDPSPF